MDNPQKVLYLQNGLQEMWCLFNREATHTEKQGTTPQSQNITHVQMPTRQEAQTPNGGGSG